MLKTLVPFTRVSKVKLFTSSPNDGKKAAELNISERLKCEIKNSDYDLVTIEVGVNEVSNNKKIKPESWREVILERMVELSLCIQEIQKENSEIRWVLLNRLYRADSASAQKLSLVMDDVMRVEFQDVPKVWIRSLKINTKTKKDQVKISFQKVPIFQQF